MRLALDVRRLAVLIALGGGGVLGSGAAAAEPERYSTPEAADEVLEASGLPFALRFASDQWAVSPQSSKFRLLARVTHEEQPISGAFVYREEEGSEETVRQRAEEELTTAFASHEVAGFTRRVVNGTPVHFLRASGTTDDGREFVIRNYYWTGPEGVADYSLVARRDVFESERGTIMELLNGFEVASAETE